MYSKNGEVICGVTVTKACPKTWDELTPTGVWGVRHCDGCNQQVVECRTEAELKRLALEGRCVAFGPRMGMQFLGEVAPPGWGDS